MILVTGANGKLGKALIKEIHARGISVRAAARAFPSGQPFGVNGIALGELDHKTNWLPALDGVHTIIHCASLSRISNDESFHLFRIANVDAVLRMVEKASILGVRRIIYVSSVSVNGKHNFSGPFSSTDSPFPESDYSMTKLEAEKILLMSNIPEIVIVRPPRILWPDFSGNIEMLAKLIRSGVPLPFGCLNENMRDNISPSNLVDALITCSQVTNIKREVFLVSDQCPLSTRGLVGLIGKRVNRKPLLVFCPKFLMRLAINCMPKILLGQLDAQGLYNELTKDLRVDISNFNRVTGWKPIYTTEQEFLGLKTEAR